MKVTFFINSLISCLTSLSLAQLQVSKRKAEEWAEESQVGRFDAADAVSHAAVDLSLQLSALKAAVAELRKCSNQEVEETESELETETSSASQEIALQQ